MFTGCVESAGVAQLVRASGSYPLGPGFKSLRRHHLFVPGFSRQPFNLSVWVRAPIGGTRDFAKLVFQIDF